LSTALTTVHLSLEPADKDRLAVLCGSFDDNIKQIERRLGVEVIYKDAQFQIVGEHRYAQACSELITDLYVETLPIKGKTARLSDEDVHLALQNLMNEHRLLEIKVDIEESGFKSLTIKTKRGVIKQRGENQT
jgi:phosphate starvation-inducible PhoH-like protein